MTQITFSPSGVTGIQIPNIIICAQQPFTEFYLLSSITLGEKKMI